jgi:hypothetical protein
MLTIRQLRTVALCILSITAMHIKAYSLTDTSKLAYGQVSGKVLDKNTGETIIGANVIIEGTTVGVATGLDGEFSLPNIPVGDLNIQVSFISYEPVIIENVKIEGGKTTHLDVVLQETNVSLEGVQVTARRVTHTEMSVIAAIRASNLVVNGISAQQISRSQDSDAASVVKRIPGVTIVDDRFIMIRGLSERYNTTMLHQIFAPSMEADVKSFSFDVIPSNLIDRIMIYKSPAPDLPGDFAGGVVKIFTKSVPSENGISMNYSSGYDPSVSLGNFRTQRKGDLHWLGFNDKYNDLPSDFPENIRSVASNAEMVNHAGRSLKNNWVAEEYNGGLNHSMNISSGYKFNIGNAELANVTAITYSNSKSIDNVSRSDYNAYDLLMQRKSFIYEFNDQQNSQKIRSGFIHNWAVTLGNNHTIDFKNQFNQLSNSQYVFRTGPMYDFGYYANSHSFHNVYRGIYSGQLDGTHRFFNEKTSVDWVMGYGYSFRDEPDYRRYRSDLDTITSGVTMYVPFGAAASYFMGRFYSEMEEKTTTAAASVTQRITFSGKPGFIPEVSLGFFYEDKGRSFVSRNIGYVRANTLSFDQGLLDVPVDSLFHKENINLSNGIKIDEQTNPSDSYEAYNNQKAAYLKLNIPFTRKIRLVTGLRVEDNTQSLHSFTLTNQPIDVVYPVTSVLPSANLSYALNNNMLFRLAYGKTLNRPEFRELAPFGFYDFSFNLVKKGNELLQTAYIQNFDLRWEWYPKTGELITVGLFHKLFTNPIESSFIPGGGSGGIKTFSFANAASGISQGIEVEVRKSLEGLTSSKLIDDLTVLFNAALIHSEVELGDAGIGQAVGERPMQGQSPYIVNAGLYYRNVASNIQVNLLYNVIGKRIFIIGFDDYPDIYEMPRNHFDLTVTKGLNNKLEIKAGVRDILNEHIILMQDANRDGHL